MEDMYLKKEDIDLIVFDFDGVMTDNRVLVDEDGKESVVVSRADGMGVLLLKEMDIPMVIISTEINKVVSKRAVKLAIPVIQGVDDKDKVLSDYCKNNQIAPDKVLYVGNDINDLAAMKLCGIAVVPGDAHKCVKDIAHVVLKTNGGYGAVRELADIII